MRKYLEVETFKDEPSLLGIRVINQREKNRREQFSKQLKNVRILFFEIGKESILDIVLQLNKANTKLIEDKVYEQTKQRIQADPEGHV